MIRLVYYLKNTPTHTVEPKQKKSSNKAWSRISSSKNIFGQYIDRKRAKTQRLFFYFPKISSTISFSFHSEGSRQGGTYWASGIF